MSRDINEIKYQTCNLCNAMLRNVNDNFISVSFDFDWNNDILVKVILEKRTEIENSYIEDMISEFSASQQSDCVIKPQVEVGNKHSPLLNIVYQQGLKLPPSGLS